MNNFNFVFFSKLRSLLFFSLSFVFDILSIEMMIRLLSSSSHRSSLIIFMILKVKSSSLCFDSYVCRFAFRTVLNFDIQFDSSSLL